MKSEPEDLQLPPPDSEKMSRSPQAPVLKKTVDLECPRCGSARIRWGRISVELSEPVGEWIKQNQLIFVRPTLTKLPAVTYYNTICSEFREHQPSWGLAHISSTNKERVLYRRVSQFMRYGKLPSRTAFSGRRVCFVTYEPQDALELALRGHLVGSSLVLLARPAYLEAHPEYARNADLVLTDGEYAAPDCNALRVVSFDSVAPTIHHWFQSWGYDNNCEFIRLYGDGSTDDEVHQQVARNGLDAVDVVIQRGGSATMKSKKPSSCQAVRSDFAASAENVYVRLALTHKFVGILSNPKLENSQKLSELLRRSVRVRDL